MEKEMTPNTKLETAKPSVRARIESVHEVAAAAAGIFEICRALGGFGREILTEAGEHVRATRSRRWPRS
jgi:hypothetical protein